MSKRTMRFMQLTVAFALGTAFGYEGTPDWYILVIAAFFVWNCVKNDPSV